MSKDNHEILKHILTAEASIVAWNPNELHPTNVPFTNAFKITDKTPVYLPLRSTLAKQNVIVRKVIEAMLAERIIKLATSPSVFPGLTAKKKDGSLILCVDYRALNKRMKANIFPSPKIKGMIDDKDWSKIFSALNGFASFWYNILAESIWEKTVFGCKFGSFQFEVISFVLMNVTSTFQRMVESLFRDLDVVRVHINEVVIGSRSIEEDLNHHIVLCDWKREIDPK